MVSPKRAGFRLVLRVSVSSNVLADLWIEAGLQLAVVAFATTDQCRKHRGVGTIELSCSWVPFGIDALSDCLWYREERGSWCENVCREDFSTR